MSRKQLNEDEITKNLISKKKLDEYGSGVALLNKIEDSIQALNKYYRTNKSPHDPEAETSVSVLNYLALIVAKAGNTKLAFRLKNLAETIEKDYYNV